MRINLQAMTMVLALTATGTVGCVESDPDQDATAEVIEQSLNGTPRTAAHPRSVAANRTSTTAQRTTANPTTEEAPQPGDIDIAIGRPHIEQTSRRGHYRIAIAMQSFNMTRMENLYASFELTSSQGVHAARRIPVPQNRDKQLQRIVFEDVPLRSGSYAILADPEQLIDETNEANNTVRFSL